MTDRIRWLASLAALLSVLLASPLAHADADREKYDMGVVALHNKDCEAAAEAFNSIQGELREDPGFINYAAQANECAGNLEKALEYYRKKEAFDTDKLKAQQKIGELLYKINKQKKEKEKKDAAAGVAPAATPADAAPAATPVPILAGQEKWPEVKFVVGQGKFFNVTIENGDGKASCDGVRPGSPCAIRLRPGKAHLYVSGGGSFSTDVDIPPVASTVTLSYGGGHGMAWVGTGMAAAGVVVIFAVAIANPNENISDGYVDLLSLLAIGVGGTICIVDLVSPHHNQATVSATSAEILPGFAPRLVGAAPFTDGRRAGGALVFEF